MSAQPNSPPDPLLPGAPSPGTRAAGSLSRNRRRGRIVSFRVSEEEYINLCKATESAGADSISDFARHVACHHSLAFINPESASITGNVPLLSAFAAAAGAIPQKHQHDAHAILIAAVKELTNGVQNGNSPKHIDAALPAIAPAVIIEITRLGKRVDELSQQLQTFARRLKVNSSSSPIQGAATATAAAVAKAQI